MRNDVPCAAAPAARFRNVVEGEWHFDPGVSRVLHVHSRGARRFSPFCAFVTAYGVNSSIESHYQESKVFEGGVRPRDWREAKSFGKRRPHGLGLRQTGWQIGPHLFDVTPNARGTSFTMGDAGVQFYIRMWHRYLTAHPELVEEARQYDGWHDPFEGDFPFGQAKVFELVARRGVAALEPLDAQHVKWPPAAQRKYFQLRARAASEVVVCPGPYTPDAMDKRNIYMVDYAAREDGLLLALWNGTAGGTRNCLAYSERYDLDRVNTWGDFMRSKRAA